MARDRAAQEPPGDRAGRDRFVLSLVLTGVILLAEVAAGVWTGSLALLSDAAHVFLDMLALGMSYAALLAANLKPNDRHTYGFHRMKVLAAFVNGATLLLVAVEIVREAAHRFANPAPVLAGPMLAVAVVGLVVNLLVAQVLRSHDRDDLNTRSAFLHVLSDALSSVGVIGGGILILSTGWTWVDPLVSVMIAVVILSSSGRVLKQAIHILNEGAPDDVAVPEVAAAMERIAGVTEVHDLHIWTVAPGYPVLSAHVVLSDRALSHTRTIMDELKQVLASRFRLEHTTIQFECSNCGQGPGTKYP